MLVKNTRQWDLFLLCLFCLFFFFFFFFAAAAAAAFYKIMKFTEYSTTNFYISLKKCTTKVPLCGCFCLSNIYGVIEKPDIKITIRRNAQRAFFETTINNQLTTIDKKMQSKNTLYSNVFEADYHSLTRKTSQNSTKFYEFCFEFGILG